jgi:low temperature requirement protein LtrA
MQQASIVSPEDQGATFIELFFDLVFVFAVTQVTHYAAHHLDLQGLARSAVVFWLIWWGWTQFTWALNAANTDHHEVRVGTLVSTAVAFAMAASVEQAFSPDGARALWFALSYIGVRALGLGLYMRVTWRNREQRSAVLFFAGLSLTGLVAVLLGALVDPSMRGWIWLAAVVFDLWAANVAGNRVGWNLHAGHFAERHGLIVIIALGESLIVAGSAVAGDANGSLLAVGGLAILVTCLLWWTYYGWIQGLLEERLVSADVSQQAPLARDAYSIAHFPLVCGIIALAVGFEAAFHPDDYSVTSTAAAVGVGLSLFLASTAGALWRAERCILWNRLIVLALTAGVLVWNASTSPIRVLAIASAGLVVIVAIEQVTVRRQLEAR